MRNTDHGRARNTDRGRALYWRQLAEDHGDCLRDFVREPAIRDELVYQQAAIAGHFANLYLGWVDETLREMVS